MKKKICFIVPTLGGGGAERVAFHLLNNLNIEKFDLTVILIYKNKGDYLKDLRKEVKKIFLEKNKIRYSIFSLYKILKQEKPEVVIVFSFEIMILIGIFLIPFFNNIYFINRQINILSMIKFNFFKKILIKIAYKNFNKIITQSNDMTKDLLKNMNNLEYKITEINNPIDIKFIEKSYKKNIKIEYNKENKNLLCVGRLVPQKGFDLIIKAMPFFNNKNIKLYILGEGEEKENLEKLIKKLNLETQVFLLGKKENPYIYMRNADLFILSSRYEGFPNVLIEAGACGTYSICNDCLGGINEIIEENINGNIIKFSNKNLLKKVIEDNLSKEKNKELIKKTVKKYSLEHIIETYQNLFLEENL